MDLLDQISYHVGRGNSGKAGSLDVGLLSGRAVVDLTYYFRSVVFLVFGKL